MIRMINIATLIHAQFVINFGYSPAIATASQRPWIVEAQAKKFLRPKKY